MRGFYLFGVSRVLQGVADGGITLAVHREDMVRRRRNGARWIRKVSMMIGPASPPFAPSALEIAMACGAL